MEPESRLSALQRRFAYLLGGIAGTVLAAGMIVGFLELVAT